MRQTLCRRGPGHRRSVAVSVRYGRIVLVTDPLAELGRLSGVAAAASAARDAADVVLRDRGRREVPAESSAIALLAGAKASAELEGPHWLPGSVRLSAALLELAPLIRISPGQFFAQAHLILARDLLPENRLGVVVDGAERVQGLCRLLTAKTEAPAIVLAAVAHAELAATAPFAHPPAPDGGGSAAGDGSGIVARAVEHAVLIEAGIDPRAALIVEAGHLPARAYRRHLDGYASGSVTGVRNWLLHCCDALVVGAEKSPLKPVRG